MQTEIVTRVAGGVDLSGLQRASRSGRGRPMAFLKMSVRREVVRIEIVRPRRRTWVRCAERLEGTRLARRRRRAGMPAA